MKVDCRTVIREIDELDDGQQPRPAVLEHTLGCKHCGEFYDERLKLREMLAGMGVVEAPADFDFRLRARLAANNDSVGSGASFRIPGFGLPSVALATVALLVGVGLSMRALMEPASNPPVAVQDSPQSEPARVTSTTPIHVTDANANAAEALSDKNAEPKKREVVTQANNRPANSNRRRVASKDFSSNPAFVLKREDLLAGTDAAAMFPLEAAEPLRVSVDDATGVSRTISVPALSFGSQHPVSRGPSMVKASARTAW